MLSSLNWGSMFSSYPPGAERPRESILAGADIRPDAATAVQTLLLTESWDTTATDTQLEDQINQSCYNVLCKIPAEVYHSRHKENISETKWDLKKALTLYLVGLWERHICTNMDCHVIWQKWKWSTYWIQRHPENQSEEMMQWADPVSWNFIATTQNCSL